MNLLYVGCGHPLQEADDCLMWSYLGLNWYSTGYYSYSKKPGDLPELHCWKNEIVHATFKDQISPNSSADTHPANVQKNQIWTGLAARNVFQFTPAFLSQFDCVVFNHFPDLVVNNWAAINKSGIKKVFLKTFNMHEPEKEKYIKVLRDKGVIVIRNSPVEWMKHDVNRFGGYNAIIRGSVVRDEDELSGWHGSEQRVVTFSSYLKPFGVGTQRRKLRYENTIANSAHKDKFRCFGIGNEGFKGSPGFISHEEKIKQLQSARVNLVVGTPVATNTYSFVEALVMGQPIVVFDRKMWDSECYEIDKIIIHGEEGFIGKTEHNCAKYIDMLLEDRDLAERISKRARLKGVAMFGRRALAEHWRQLFIAERLM